ncbi:MAG TPA: DUF4129 domain-containing protein [Bryobacteraceae bacterium]|jgi:hypothetical protein|nr:DUF4129 domain-containing protein [Bryobacteraceae bacterium]
MKESGFRGALRLLEEAIALSRSADAVTWLAYLIGAVPFLGLVLYEVTNIEQNPFAADQVLVLAFVLAILFFWMHICQAVFCARLFAIHSERDRNLGREFREATNVQAVVAGTKVWAWPIGLTLMIPHAAITMFYQSSLIGSGSGGGNWRAAVREAKQDASYRPGEAVWLVIIVFLLRAILWMNLLVLLFNLPGLWKTLTGMETDITRWPELLDNATALSAVSALAYLALDPVVKAACVLRRFERQSRRSGLDLRLRLKVLGRATVLVAILSFGWAGRSWAADARASIVDATRTAGPPVTPEHMDRAVRSVFRDPAEAWNLPLVEPRKKSSNPIFAFMDAVTKRAGNWWKEFGDWLRGVIARQPRPGPSQKHGPANGTSAWVLVGVFSGLVGMGVLLAWWRRTAKPAPMEVPTEATAQKFDVASDTVLPDDQPEDEWVRLSREYRAKGNLRLALRALYLSILAALARAGLITISRGKSNRDYLREVQRRGRRLGPQLAAIFGSTVQTFEKTWYGTFLVTAEVLDEFEENVQQLHSSLANQHS